MAFIFQTAFGKNVVEQMVLHLVNILPKFCSLGPNKLYRSIGSRTDLAMNRQMLSNI